MRTVMLLMALCGVASAQSGGGSAPVKKSEKSELEKMLEDALKGHPDISTAEAKVLLARAELEKARREIAHKVVAAYHAAQASRDMLVESKRRLKAIMDARARVATSFSLDDVMIAQLTVSRYENEVKGAEAALSVLTGKGDTPAALKLGGGGIAFSTDGGRLHAMDGHGPFRIWDARTGKEVTGAPAKDAVTGTMAERIRKALDKKMTLAFDSVELIDALSYMGKSSGLHIRGPAAKGTVTTGDVGEVTFGAACQLIEDTLPGHRFVVREYGLLFVPEDKVPPDAVTLMAFWKGGAAKTDAPARKDVEGKVTQVADKGLLKLDIGSDAGVARGGVSPQQKEVPPASRLLRGWGLHRLADHLGHLGRRDADGGLLPRREGPADMLLDQGVRDLNGEAFLQLHDHLDEVEIVGVQRRVGDGGVHVQRGGIDVQRLGDDGPDGTFGVVLRGRRHPLGRAAPRHEDQAQSHDPC